MAWNGEDLYQKHAEGVYRYLFALCREAGNPDMVFEYASTSKITLPGAGVSCFAASEANLALKVSIVRSAGWIAVGIFGESAIHPMTSHERCGLGIMNI